MLPPLKITHGCRRHLRSPRRKKRQFPSPFPRPSLCLYKLTDLSFVIPPEASNLSAISFPLATVSTASATQETTGATIHQNTPDSDINSRSIHQVTRREGTLPFVSHLIRNICYCFCTNPTPNPNTSFAQISNHLRLSKAAVAYG